MKLLLVLALALALSTQSSARMRGGNGGGKRGGGRGGPFSVGGRFDDDDFIDVQCGAGVTAETCGLVGNETGTLVCRTRSRNNSTRPVCAANDEGIAGDVCGCCGETCPLPCTSPCTEVTGGVLIASVRNANKTRCVSPSDSVTLQLKGRRICVV